MKSKCCILLLTLVIFTWIVMLWNEKIQIKVNSKAKVACGGIVKLTTFLLTPKMYHYILYKWVWTEKLWLATTFRTESRYFKIQISFTLQIFKSSSIFSIFSLTNRLKKYLLRKIFTYIISLWYSSCRVGSIGMASWLQNWYN